MSITDEVMLPIANSKYATDDRMATRVGCGRYRVAETLGNHPFVITWICPVVVFLASFGSVISPSIGAVGDPVSTLSPQFGIGSQFCSIGLAFDGASLYFNRCGDPNIYAISPVDGSLIRTFDTGIPEWPAAMAFDAKRNGLWFGTQKGIGVMGFSGCGSIGMPIYFWDFGNDSVTLMFTIPLNETNPTTGDLFFALCILDGLGYNENNFGDPNDDEVWISDNRNPNIGVLRPNGVLVNGFNGQDVDASLLNCSGLTTASDKLYLANDGIGDVFRTNRTPDPVSGKLTLGSPFTNGSLWVSDMACDPVTFAPTEVMWVRTSPQGISANDIITAYEIEPGGCGQSGAVGACCVSATVSCVNDVSQTTCQAMQGIWMQGATCQQTVGCVTHEIVLLDRTGSMNALRQATGNTRCFDALETAKMDVDNFFDSHSAGSSLAVWTFAGNGPTDLTGGFVTDANTANAALATLDMISCSGSTPLAESMCDAVDAMTAAFPGVPDKARILAVSSDGDENFSDMNCNGPNSVAGMTCGSFDPGSWQQLVCTKMVGNGVAQVRFWGAFGPPNVKTSRTIDPETATLRSASIPDTVFFQALADATGGSLVVLDDSPPPVTGPSIFGVIGACCLPDGTCQEPITEAECAVLNGTHQGDASVCADATGACCLMAGSCQDGVTQSICSGMSGTFQGTCTTCANDVAGACCLPDSTCQDGLTPPQCTALSGTHQGGCSVCSGAPGECDVSIPTVSEWGVAAMTLLVLTAGTVILRRHADNVV